MIRTAILHSFLALLACQLLAQQPSQELAIEPGPGRPESCTAGNTVELKLLHAGAPVPKQCVWVTLNSKVKFDGAFDKRLAAPVQYIVTSDDAGVVRLEGMRPEEYFVMTDFEVAGARAHLRRIVDVLQGRVVNGGATDPIEVSIGVEGAVWLEISTPAPEGFYADVLQITHQSIGSVVLWNFYDRAMQSDGHLLAGYVPAGDYSAVVHGGPKSRNEYGVTVKGIGTSTTANFGMKPMLRFTWTFEVKFYEVSGIFSIPKGVSPDNCKVGIYPDDGVLGRLPFVGSALVCGRDGSFTASVMAGNYVVEGWVNGTTDMAFERISVNGDVKKVKLKIAAKQGRIRVAYAEDPSSGAPAPRVRLLDAKGEAEVLAQGNGSRLSGGSAVLSVEPGTYIVEIYGPGWQTTRSKKVRVSDGKLEEVTMSPTRTASLKVEFTDFSITECSVILCEFQDAAGNPVQGDGTGELRIDVVRIYSLPAGCVRVILRSPGFEDIVQEVNSKPSTLNAVKVAWTSIKKE